MPPTTGSVAKCTECSFALAGACQIDPSKAGKPCKDDGDLSTEDVCTNGKCMHNPIVVAIGGISTPFRNEVVNHDDPKRIWPRDSVREGDRPAIRSIPVRPSGR